MNEKDRKELKNLIELLGYDLDDLSKWDVDHDDTLNGEMGELREAYRKVVEKSKTL